MSGLNPEIEEGNIEYKRYLINLDRVRLEQLATQMKWRLTEGDNEAIYYLGVNDNGSIYPMEPSEAIETFENFNLLVNKNNAEIINLSSIIIQDENSSNVTYYKATIRKSNPILPEIRVLLLGDSESGKTTFLANLILEKAHNERTDPRIYLMNHKHEIETKKTSSANCNYIIHNQIKYAFIEAPGYYEYTRTKYKLLLGTCPDIILLFANPDGNPNKFDNFICENLSIPFIHIDIFDPDSDFNCKKLIDKNLLFDKINQIYKPKPYNNSNIKINILNVYPHNDLGTVVSGFLVSGNLKIAQQLTWTYRDETTSCIVKSIHINSEPVNEICTNQMLTICLKTSSPIKKNWRNGLLTSETNNQIKKEIKFIFNKLSDSSDLPNSIYCFCSNRIVNIYDIQYINKQFIGTIENYIQGDNSIVVDFGTVKGIIKII